MLSSVKECNGIFTSGVSCVSFRSVKYKTENTGSLTRRRQVLQFASFVPLLANVRSEVCLLSFIIIYSDTTRSVSLQMFLVLLHMLVCIYIPVNVRFVW
jgi:hypothetical protein